MPPCRRLLGRPGHLQTPWYSSGNCAQADIIWVLRGGGEHTNEILGRGVPLMGLLGGAACLLLLPTAEPVHLAAASAAASAASHALAASAVTAICTQCSHG